ncbi:MFS general substrate transporter [Trametes elegans]|nr:MFS general substrate transporter [Trametes elegans]
MAVSLPPTAMDYSATTTAKSSFEKLPGTPADLEEGMSKEVVELSVRPADLDGRLEQTPAMRRRAALQLAALCISVFVTGWNDGTLGPLLPRLQEVYNVGYATVSFVFIINCTGAIFGSCIYIYTIERFRYGVAVVVASFVMMAAFAVEAASVPFPAFIAVYFFVGLSAAFLNGGSCAFLANVSLGQAPIKFALLHGAYGLGAMASPLVSTQFSRAKHWSRVYLIHIGILAMTAVVQIVAFRFKSQEDCAQEIGIPPSDQEPESVVQRYKKVFKLPAVHLMALFSFIYVGSEVAIGNWIVTYIIKLRNGGPSSGYISSGLFGGLMVGRIALLPVTKLVGPRRGIFLYILAVIGCELIVWLVPSLIADAIAVSFVGFFLGPLMPILTNHAGGILPPDLISGGVGWAASWGSAGAAVFPFITGAIASKTGIEALNPMVVTLMGILFVVWACVPQNRKQI